MAGTAVVIGYGLYRRELLRLSVTWLLHLPGPQQPARATPEILLEISISAQIRLSRNFRGNKHIPADGVAGNVRRPSCKHVLVTHTHGTCQIGAQSGTFLKNGTSDLMTCSYSGPEKEPRIVLLDHLHCVHEIEKP